MRIFGVVLAVVLVIVYAAGSGRWVSTNSEWYLALQQPAWQPPNAVFGIAWAYNFTMLVVVGIILALRAPQSVFLPWLIIFAFTVALAIGWSYLFYGPHALVASAICLSLCFLGTIVLVVMAWQQQWWLGAVMLPYVAWLAVASSLSWGYATLN